MQNWGPLFSPSAYRHDTHKALGSLDKGVARGLTLRMDHGTQYLSDHFLNQVKCWGIKPSFSFVAQPQTNGVAERFNWTMKEQAIHGQNFVTIDEVRKAVVDFVKLYNEQWQIEKMGFKSPEEARHYRSNQRKAAKGKAVLK